MPAGRPKRRNAAKKHKEAATTASRKKASKVKRRTKAKTVHVTVPGQDPNKLWEEKVRREQELARAEEEKKEKEAATREGAKEFEDFMNSL